MQRTWNPKLVLCIWRTESGGYVRHWQKTK